MKYGGFVPLIQAGRGGITSAKLTREWGAGAVLSIHAEVSHLGGPYERGEGQAPHFSVTCQVVTTESRRRRDIAGGGCLHDLALEYWPELAPIVALHLAHADDGTPMHAEGNGFYWLEGLWGPKGFGGGDSRFGGPYHGGNADIQWVDENGQHRYGPAPLRHALAIFADHIRVRADEAAEIADQLAQAAAGDWAPCDACEDGLTAQGTPCPECVATGRLSFRKRMRKAWLAKVATMRPRWAAEAREGLRFLWEHATPPDLRDEWHKRVLAVLGVDLERDAVALPIQRRW